ncbi:MAG: serine/threonine protein kinase [Candidatus Bathyarchaeota archaeon]|nr:serine/threonine protein kinase [Candidatus Bathyarchaeota archaeon]MDH5495229.1 serine/threonine protein kinase [Candidatus Bathyarchaeota archaeon]
MKSNKKVTLELLGKEKYRRIICYPKYKTDEFKHRLKELKQLSIEAIEFTGQKHVHNTPVLGKGCVGIVVTAYKKDEKVALKIRRTDANRSTMQREAQMLKRANKINVGPGLLGITKNFLLMEYVEGLLLPEWTGTLTEKDVRKRLRRALRLILEQAWRLDKAGLDHGELSHAPKHIIVKPDDVPYLVDFETASISRHVSNVTSLCQYLFIGSPIAKYIQIQLDDIDKDNLVNALRTYKESRDRKDFKEVLSKCGVL